jgi:hypothetical protein
MQLAADEVAATYAATLLQPFGKIRLSVPLRVRRNFSLRDGSGAENCVSWLA